MRREKWIAYTAIIIVIITLASSAVIQDDKQDLKSEYIRFHVIANSDSPEDQALKLRVRDLLLKRFRDEFGKANSIEDSHRLINDSLTEIEHIARQEIQRSGKEYLVQARLGDFEFPTKAYGNLVLPAGEYEALRVVIGEGEGANWWCVMFPPLCFVDITHGVAKEQVADSDSHLDEPSEVHNDKQVQIKYKFKITELWDRLLSFLNIG